jgi:tRNA uridine 5-carbamoylmethylation protein Kti12
MCGIPGSGKTSRAKEIQSFIQQTYKREVIIINEESLQLQKDQAYKDS